MATLNDVKYAALATLTGQTGSLDDLEYAWLIDVTASEGPSQINDLWLLALAQQGYTEGSFGDRMFDFLVAEGYTGSLNDMLFQWWSAGGGFGGVPAGAIVDRAGNPILDRNGNYIIVRT